MERTPASCGLDAGLLDGKIQGDAGSVGAGDGEQSVAFQWRHESSSRAGEWIDFDPPQILFVH